MAKGVYCLVFFTRGCTVRIGALGELPFPEGYYIYVGSALGSGGLKRLERHISLSTHRDKSPKWHVDYLSVNPHFALSYTVSAETPDHVECELAEIIGGAGIPQFGCSDCECETHLFFRKKDPEKELRKAFRALKLVSSLTVVDPSKE